ncbi:membrane-associated kinase regulator [Tasmannia lanceolata]|uniref:membrane-associated kinase regulator n=1 Tax=Tasmannia lanceolata TaxID=3420 RepID=UPI004062B92E
MEKPPEKDKDQSFNLLNLSSSSPPSPSSSSSSSDFEFTVSLSPKSHSKSSHLCPADELFYKGQLLPLHLSPRLSMVRTLLASSSSSSSSDTATTASRDSSGSSTDISLLSESDSSRPSSATEDEFYKKIPIPKKPNKYFSLSRFSSIFLPKDNKITTPKKISTSAKEVIRKYVKKVKPLYEKFSSKQQQQHPKMSMSMSMASYCVKPFNDEKERNGLGPNRVRDGSGSFSHSFSGNLRYPRRRSVVGSCPSSMRSSPTHSGVLYSSDRSEMEELQSAIQGAITHCKNSMTQVKI